MAERPPAITPCRPSNCHALLIALLVDVLVDTNCHALIVGQPSERADGRPSARRARARPRGRRVGGARSRVRDRAADVSVAAKSGSASAFLTVSASVIEEEKAPTGERSSALQLSIVDGRALVLGQRRILDGRALVVAQRVAPCQQHVQRAVRPCWPCWWLRPCEQPVRRPHGWRPRPCCGAGATGVGVSGGTSRATGAPASRDMATDPRVRLGAILVRVGVYTATAVGQTAAEGACLSSMSRRVLFAGVIVLAARVPAAAVDLAA